MTEPKEVGIGRFEAGADTRISVDARVRPAGTLVLAECDVGERPREVRGDAGDERAVSSFQEWLAGGKPRSPSRGASDGDEA